MIFIATPKQLPKGYLKYVIFEVDDNGTLISAGWADQIQDLKMRFEIPSKTVPMWGIEYSVHNFFEELSKDRIIFTTESHPEYFI